MVLENKELRLRVSADGKIRVEDAPTAPRPPDCDFDLPKDENDTRRQTLKVLMDMLEENRLKKESEFRVLGALLYSVLFENNIGEYLHREVEEKRAPYLRVVLQFEDDTNLASWPWEYLYCPITDSRPNGGYFFTETENLLLSRRLPTADFGSFRVERTPVKVLFVASSPEEHPKVTWRPVLGKIQSLSERSTKSATEGDRTDVRVRVLPLLPNPDESEIPGSTYETFLSTLNDEKPHIIHFVGHGDFHEGQGRIMFMTKSGTAQPITDGRLARDISAKAGKALKLVFIQACESARSDPDALLDRYQAVSGIASNLAVKRVPAVVAMQYAIDNDFAEVFACAFYDALADGNAVDIAVHGARQAVAEAQRQHEEEGSEDSSSPAFALPVLYWQSLDGVFPSLEGDEIGESAQPDDTLEPDTPQPLDKCVWCGMKIGAKDNFCASGHPVRCVAEKADRPGGICGWPVKTNRGPRCVHCGSLLPQTTFEDPAASAKEAKVTPAITRAEGEMPSWQESRSG